MLLAKALFDWALKRFKHTEIGTMFKNQVEKDNLINEQLSYLKDRYNFNRVVLVDYHNGTSSFKGESFKNASARYEKVDHKTKSVLKDFKDVPTSILSEMLLELENSKNGWVTYEEDSMRNDQTSFIHRMYGAQQSYTFKIGKDLADGVVTLIRTDKIEELNPCEIIDIQSVVNRIAIIRKQKNKFKIF